VVDVYLQARRDGGLEDLFHSFPGWGTNESMPTDGLLASRLIDLQKRGILPGKNRQCGRRGPRRRCQELLGRGFYERFAE
jgi:hypothetical protein